MWKLHVYAPVRWHKHLFRQPRRGKGGRRPDPGSRSRGELTCHCHSTTRVVLEQAAGIRVPTNSPQKTTTCSNHSKLQTVVNSNSNITNTNMYSLKKKHDLRAHRSQKALPGSRANACYCLLNTLRVVLDFALYHRSICRVQPPDEE